MNLKLLGATAAVALGLTASSAFAAEIVSITAIAGNINDGIPLITDFNSTGGTGADNKGGTIDDLNPAFTFTQDTPSLAYTRDGHAGLDSGVSAPPPEDNGGPVGSFYETVQGGGSATLTSLVGISEFSFYMGSPDDFNHVKLTFSGAGGSQTLDGTAIWGGTPPGNGDQSEGFTVIYKFSPDTVNTINFTSDNNAFEFDTLRGGVPEPASWALMIMGFGAAGAMMRRRKAVMA
ncbi:PEPxxWA-CTERM sorting domain-containing protein [Phenylobacterium sp.]|uniref:PEPxxWA-CTERM sorting domain-containing protein n=1 Tax=Phenylobacterium sp. TaxID=1871053 RepID=UPI002F42D434